MASFFHSFPRANRKVDNVTNEERWEVDEAAYSALSSILTHGFLCTPEWLEIRPARDTEDPRKQKLIEEHKPEYCHSQCRLCFTLCEPEDLYRPIVRGLSSSAAQVASHAELFGPWAIGLDPIFARRLGILPTAYYSPTDMYGLRDGKGRIPGLHLQLIQRLKEMRELFAVLAYLEAGQAIGDGAFPSEEALDALDMQPRYEEKVLARVRSLTSAQRDFVFGLFDIDRSCAFDLVSHVDMLLGLFQESDSSKDGTPYAFYQQREWRLIHHMRRGLVWYCLGPQPTIRDPISQERRRERAALRRLLTRRPREDQESYLNGCWVLEEVDGRRPSEFITEIIVPAAAVRRVEALAASHALEARITPAEQYGYRAASGSTDQGRQQEEIAERE